MRDGLPIWIGSWGSDAGLRRVARLGDGWLASGYNTTPTMFGEAWKKLPGLLTAAGKNASEFPNAIATMWTFISEDRAETERVLQMVSQFLGRPREELEERLPIGSAAVCAEKLVAYRAAGVQRMFLWPVGDEVRQIERFAREVRPLVEGH